MEGAIIIHVGLQAAQDAIAAANRRREMLKAVVAAGAVDARASGTSTPTPSTPAKPHTRGTSSATPINEDKQDNITKRIRAKTTPLSKTDPVMTPSVCTPAPKTAKLLETEMATPGQAVKSLSFDGTPHAIIYQFA